jgi:hypothetical protein
VQESSSHHTAAASLQLQVHDLGTRGIRSLAVAKTSDEGMTTWEILGMLTFLDPPRPDTQHTIEQALENGVDVKMVTGDQVLGIVRVILRSPATTRLGAANSRCFNMLGPLGDLTLEKFSSTIVSHVQAERKILTRVIPILLELVRLFI